MEGSLGAVNGQMGRDNEAGDGTNSKQTKKELMERFFIGMHHPSECWAFRNVMVSVNRLFKRKSHFRVNDWIMDSGAFSQLAKVGNFVMSEDEYLERINYFSGCGNLLAAVAQDWMCEDFVLEKTGKSIAEHQELTIKSFVNLGQWTQVPIMPVLQGFSPSDYASHVRAYGSLLKCGHWTGLGSVCRRNGNPDAIEDVLLAIKGQRPDLRLHGFGLKISALERPTVRALLYSSDSMAWSHAGRKENKRIYGAQLSDADDPRVALSYAAKVEQLIEHPVLVQKQLFKWWN